MSTEGGRTWRTWQLLAAAGVSFLLGVGAGTSGAEKDETVSATDTTQAPAQVTAAPTTPTVPTTPAPTVATTTTVAGPKTTFPDGSYRVGVDIAPGTYRSSRSGSDCYWARLSNFTGSDNLLANYLSSSPTTVTILATDVGFESKRCGTWTKVG